MVRIVAGDDSLPYLKVDLLYGGANDDDPDVVVGTLTGRVCNPYIIEYDLMGACDDESQDLLDAYLWAMEDGRLNETLRDETEERASGFIYLESLVIKPEHRGKDLSLAMLNEAIRTLYLMCPLFIIKPFPQDHERADLDGKAFDAYRQSKEYETFLKNATPKLKALYQRAGFKEVDDSGYMIHVYL